MSALAFAIGGVALKAAATGHGIETAVGAGVLGYATKGTVAKLYQHQAAIKTAISQMIADPTLADTYLASATPSNVKKVTDMLKEVSDAAKKGVAASLIKEEATP
jgi:hypothetical protein